MEDTAAASQPSCISRPAPMSSGGGDSSWAIHFAGFLASSGHGDDQDEMDRRGEGVSHSSFSSSSFDSLDSFITSDKARDEDDDGGEDDSLQDTACSSLARPKAKYFADESSRQQAAGAVQEAVNGGGGGNNNENQQHGCNDLRKRGLCLVPLSMLIDYLG